MKSNQKLKTQRLLFISLISLTLCFIGCSAGNTGHDLIIETIQEGSGDRRVENGNFIHIHESTSYRDGTEVFSTRNTMKKPLRFEVGADHVIKGVDLGVVGMKEGEIRKLIVPTKLSQRTGYPEFISPDSILVYEIELIEIE